MAYFTENLGLRVWDRGDDDFSRSELANNWAAIDVHDHGPGNGLQIPEAGIADNAVSTNKIVNLAVSTAKLTDDAVTETKVADDAILTNHIGDGAVQTDNLFDGAVTTVKLGDLQVATAKLADGAVTGPKVANGAIGTAALADAAVTTVKIGDDQITNAKIADQAVNTDQLATGAVTTPKYADASITPGKLDPNVLPVGTVIPWFRPSDATSIPTGWVVAIGQTLQDADHDFAEATSITIPDLRNKFILGAATSDTGTSPSTAPAIGTAGSSQERDIGAGSVTAHYHAITNDSHTHGIMVFPEGQPYGVGVSRSWASMKIPISDYRWSDGTDWHRNYGAIHWIDIVGYMDAGDPFGSAGPNTTGIVRWQDAKPVIHKFPTNTSTHTHSHGSKTGDVVATDSTAVTTDMRPAYVGLLYLMKVKNT